MPGLFFLFCVLLYLFFLLFSAVLVSLRFPLSFLLHSLPVLSRRLLVIMWRYICFLASSLRMAVSLHVVVLFALSYTCFLSCRAGRASLCELFLVDFLTFLEYSLFHMPCSFPWLTCGCNFRCPVTRANWH